MPGLSVAIAGHGRIVYDEALGLANRENDEKLTSSELDRMVWDMVREVAEWR